MRVLIQRIRRCASTSQSPFKKNLEVNAMNFPEPSNFDGVLKLLKEWRAAPQKLQVKNYAIIQEWLIKCVPMLCRRFREIVTNDALGDVFWCIYKMKLDRSQLFNLVQKDLNTQIKLSRVSFLNLQWIYSCLVNFKNVGNCNLSQRIRNYMIQHINKSESITENKVLHFLFFLKNIVLDNTITYSTKSDLVKKIAKVLTTNYANQLASIEKNDKNIMHFSNMYEVVKIYKINVGEQLLQLFLASYEKVDQHIKNRKEQANSDLIFYDSWKIFGKSTFEKIFFRRLSELGYEFDKNVTLKGNEYDVIIRGKLKQKYCPLANIDIFNCNPSQIPSIDLQTVRQIAESNDLESIVVNTRFEEPVVLNLNGPQHYINSDTLPFGTVTRVEEFKYEKLLLHGIKKYSIINYIDWQKVDRYEKTTDNLIIKQIKDPTIIKIPQN